MDLIKLNLGCGRIAPLLKSRAIEAGFVVEDCYYGWCYDTQARHPDTWKKGTVDNGANVFLKGIKHA